ncbi:hypothetical protein [Capybara microvirus Cap1_SP_161]|nr:hypothetical protein [Capybara microvirus Cap1_SP_161]
MANEKKEKISFSVADFWNNRNLSVDFDSHSDEKRIELGTFLPLKVRIQQMLQSGQSLQAYRMALSDYVNGVEDSSLDDMENLTQSKDFDEIEALKIKDRFAKYIGNQLFNEVLTGSKNLGDLEKNVSKASQYAQAQYEQFKHSQEVQKNTSESSQNASKSVDKD